MEYIAGKTDFKLKNSAITLGKFDGLHLGHQLLMNEVISYKGQGYQAVMFSFLMHPGSFFVAKDFELIYTEEEKVNKLRRMGIDVLVSYPFTEETRKMEPEDFIKDVLVGNLDAKVIVVGSDFRFGHNRRGDVHMLKEMEKIYGFQVNICDKRAVEDTVISSTVVRTLLKEGRIDKANELLGEPFSVLGTVLHGRKIGRTLGIPTINIQPPKNKLLPPFGVYVTYARIDGVRHHGVTSIGVKPTVTEDRKIGVETYLLDFDGDLYGKEVEIELKHYLRPEFKFDTMEELKLRMEQDIRETKMYFEHPHNSAD